MLFLRFYDSYDLELTLSGTDRDANFCTFSYIVRIGFICLKKLCSLQTVQNRAFYLIEAVPIKDQIPSERENVEKSITYDRAIIVHKILKKKCPENLKGKFTRRTQLSKYETRKINDLQLPTPLLELSKKSLRRRCKYLG